MDAESVAAILQALATPSRLRILDRLQDGPHSVGELTQALGMEQSAVSHQLRHLRDLDFVIAERQGRHIFYRLFDDHVAKHLGRTRQASPGLHWLGGTVFLFDREQAISHAEHLRLSRGDAEISAAPALSQVRAVRQ